MTDTARVANVYYDMNVYNPTSNPVLAEIDNKLLFPLLNTSDNYSVAVTKSKIPLDSVPLTQSNIGLKKYQLGLKVGTTEEFAYVRQVNANQDNFVWNIPKGSTTVTKSKYSALGVITSVSTQDISIYVSVVESFVVDDYSNLFVVSIDSVSELPNKVFVIDENNNLLQTMNFSHVKHIYIDRGQNLYVCDDAVVPTVYIYGMQNQIGQVTISLKQTLTTNKAGNPLTNILFCVADQEIIVGYNQNNITIYNGLYAPQTDIVEASISQLQNLANINYKDGTYIIANIDELDDILFGTKSQEVFNIEQNLQLTTGNIISPFSVVTNTGFGFAVGTDNFTYAVNYPIGAPPASFFQANNINSLHAGGIWSEQHRGTVYGMSTTYQYLVWNYVGKNPASVPNTWTKVGELALSTNQTPYAINVDQQNTTNKIICVGSDNLLYQSVNRVGQIEILFNNQTQMAPLSTGYIQALGTYSSTTGVQENYLVTNTNFTPNMYGMFREGLRYFVADGNGINLTIFSAIDYSVIATYPAYDNNLVALTYFPLAGLFGYANNSNEIVIKNIVTLATTYTVTGLTYFVSVMYELNASHFVVVPISNDNIYIYQYGNNTPVLTIPINVSDICVSQKDLVNGVPTLFIVEQTIPSVLKFGQKIVKYTFTNNTFTVVDTITTIYTVTGSQLISFLDYHENIEALVFIVGDLVNDVYLNQQITTLFYYGNYSLTNATTSANSWTSTPFIWPQKDTGTYLNQHTMSTHSWVQIPTGGVPIKSACVSRSNQNKFYCIGSADSLLYQGTLIGGTCTLTRMIEYTQTYDYIQSTPNTTPLLLSTLYLYGLQSQNLITSLQLNDECGSIARNDVADQYIVSLRTLQQIQALSSANLANIFTSNLSGAYRLFVKNGSDIDAGRVAIYDMAIFIDAVNVAFSEVTTKINQIVGQGTITSAPVLSLDYNTGLCTLTYPQALASNNGILFNNNLLSLIYFLSTLDTKSGLYQLQLNTQQGSTTQQSKSIYKFNELDKILFQSNCIYVVGAYFGLNQSNNIITDIDVVISDFVENLGQTLYFQPNFLRTYALQSNLPLERIQLNILYQYRNGQEYQLYVNLGQNVTTKIQFVKKF